MSIDMVGILVLALVFAIGTWRSINLGALALVAAALLGTGLAGASLKDVYAGFPADLFVLLVGVTFLFGVATANGTVEWVVDRAVHLVGDHARALPWVLFVVAAIPNTPVDGDGEPAVSAGSPRATNDTASPLATAGATVTRTSTALSSPPRGALPKLTRPQIITIAAVVLILVGAIGFGLDIGVLALVAAVALRLATPQSSEGAEKSIAWNVVLLICGILTYVALLQHIGTIDRVGNAVADMRTPLFAAFVICLIAGAVSAFASSTATIGALIPLSVPLLAQGDLPTVAFIVALSISATAVDATPFSTVGALTVANAPASQQQRIFKGMLRWGLSMILVAPAAAWLIFVLIPTL
jgi:di/tricarboxylate transporter